MAKVTITATAHVRNGVMKDEDTRKDVLDTVGKNENLFKDLRDTFKVGLAQSLVRTKKLNGKDVYVVVENLKEWSCVGVKVVDFSTGETLGTAIYGFTKFFADLDSED